MTMNTDKDDEESSVHLGGVVVSVIDSPRSGFEP